MSKNYREITRHVSTSLAKLRADKPDLLKGFSALAQAAARDGALDGKTKELIALALGVAAHCDACIGFHMRTLIKLGATLGEVEEALGMAVYMGGGPSLMYAADVLAAFEELSCRPERSRQAALSNARRKESGRTEAQSKCFEGRWVHLGIDSAKA